MAVSCVTQPKMLKERLLGRLLARKFEKSIEFE